MFSLPRNMMNAQFPEDSPLHDVFPDGFSGEGDPGTWMLNAVYGQVPELYPGILGESENEGADAIKQAVAGSLGTHVDYYLLINLLGFQQLVDAIGGVTVNINEPVAINGNTDLGIPPTGYLEPGPGPAPRRLPRALVLPRPLGLRRLRADAAAALHGQRDHRRGRPAERAAPLPGPGEGGGGDPPHRHPAQADAGLRRPRPAT